MPGLHRGVGEWRYRDRVSLSTERAQKARTVRPFPDGCVLARKVSKQLVQAANLVRVARLHCGHFFHNICLLEYWDKPHMYRHRCPICRQFPRLNVSRQRVPRERNDKRTLQTDEARTWLELNAHAVMEEIADEPDMGPINELKWQELASWQRIEWIQLEREYEGLEGGGRVRNFWA